MNEIVREIELRRARREYALFDTGLAVQNRVFQAVREGLIAHPVAGFKPVQIKELLEIPEEYVLITLVVLGYPGDPSLLSEKHRQAEAAGQERKPREETVAFNGWSFS
jgi:glutaredoxin-dependent peroxiredoxin